MIPACAPSVTAKSIAIVVALMTQGIVQRDFSAIDRYISDGYINHNPQGTNGKGNVIGLLNAYPNLQYTAGGIVGNCDIVMLYGRYTNFGPKAIIGTDIFRIDLKTNKIVEHWDTLQPEVPTNETASGNPMFTYL